jgi:hypothetical protein
MPTLRTSLLVALTVTPLLGMGWLDTFPRTRDFLASRDETHQAVLALEAEPLHENAELVRAILVGHYEGVDYIICGTAMAPLAEHESLAPVMWQMVIASGDWVEAHPDRAKDIDAYTLAGLEAGVRVYRKIVASDPASRLASMDALAAEYANGTLDEWNLAHPCRPE